jgi:hypothetical protein
MAKTVEEILEDGEKVGRIIENCRRKITLLGESKIEKDERSILISSIKSSIGHIQKVGEEYEDKKHFDKIIDTLGNYASLILHPNTYKAIFSSK